MIDGLSHRSAVLKVPVCRWVPSFFPHILRMGFLLLNRFAHSAGPYCMIATASPWARGHCGAAEEEEDEDGEGEGRRRG